MALTTGTLKRIFKFKNLELDDPNPKMDPKEVLQFYSSTYPELTTATVDEYGQLNMADSTMEFEIKTTVGVKG